MANDAPQLEVVLSENEKISHEVVDPDNDKPETVQTTNVPAVDLPQLVRLVATEVVSRAEQACRYALKHQDLSDSPPEYKMGWEVGAMVCEAAIKQQVDRHFDDILRRVTESLPNATAQTPRREQTSNPIESHE
jgi:hypothetical protein